MSTTQQFDLYRSESRVEEGQRFDSQAAIQQFIDTELIDTPWWPERFPKVRTISCPTVHRGRGEGSVVAWFEDDWTGQVEMHKLHWNLRTVCHEVAHVCADSEGSTGHDPIFAGIYLYLVFRLMGQEVWQALRTACIEDGICFDKRCLETEGCECG